ncbi:MAG: PQQ-dependent sugar dehydrogenase [Pirellulaceae bacterium]|nr:PQQ-dependent sugar dehydrogenase [Pirellulaceae bacterium]
MFRSCLVLGLTGLAWLTGAALSQPVGATEPSMAKGVDQSPLSVDVVVAFPELKFDRPVVVTHGGDGTDRVFVAGQKGIIYVMPNDPTVKEPSVLLDIEDKVAYDDRMNEEGLLGMAFHPKFKENGEFFLYYTSKSEEHLSVISRFKTNKERTQALASSEQVLMTVKQPFWNHNGGTLEFGKDGYLYIAFGDGGKGDDPLQSAQDLTSVLGKILRIDIDSTSPGLQYGIPQDNPFVKTSGARREIYAYGVRNPWRISFDRQTGDLWCADVGQNLWEEISIVPKGGNCGWSKREATHVARPGAKTFIENDLVTKSPDFVDPIWEYPHTDAWGKSITGGQVYRGVKLPALKGYYLYGDYVTGRLWALKADKSGKVSENRVIAWASALPIVTFGEDEKGEVYFTSTNGGRIYTFKSK